MKEESITIASNSVSYISVFTIFSRVWQVEQALSEKKVLQEKLATCLRKYEAAKARVTCLEGDVGNFKDQLRFLLKKADTDNCLIDALRKEVG